MATKREQEIIKAKLLIYDTADDELIDGLSTTERAILKAVNGLLNKVDTVDGKLVNNEGTLTFINELNKRIEKIIRDSTLTGKVDAYLKKFQKIDGLNTRLMKEVNGINIENLNLNPIKTQAIKELSEALTSPQSIKTQMAKPIKDIMFQSVVTGMTLEDAKETLNDFITGGGKRLGSVRRYVSQIARDSLSQYDGLVNAQIAREYELDAYRYVGSLIQDSRPQCVRWVGKAVLKVEELPAELAWADKNGRGLIPGTTPENFPIYRGGYNCRHMAIPFRLPPKE
jgi:hypothetical protein